MQIIQTQSVPPEGEFREGGVNGELKFLRQCPEIEDGKKGDEKEGKFGQNITFFPKI